VTATSAHQIAVCNYIAGLGNTIKLFATDPGTTGTSPIATTPASANTTWGGAADGTGADAGMAVATGSAANFSIPPNTTATFYGIFNGSTFLRGHALDAGITTNANGSVSVDVVPKTKYKGGQ
jgi:hypothetical protein